MLSLNKESIVLYLLLLIFSQQFVVDCLRVDQLSAQGDDKSSGWRTVEVADSDDDSGESPAITGENSSAVGKKLVEWDDDYQENKVQERGSLPRAWKKVRSSRPKNSLKTNNRLVYHGQVKQNSTIKLKDGLKIQIDTHRALPINRKSSGLQPKRDEEERATTTELPAKQWSPEIDIATNKPASSAELMKSSSDWRPVVMMAGLRSRRSGKTALESKKTTLFNNATSPNVHSKEQSSIKWKPIVSETEKTNEEEREPTPTTELPKVAKKKDSQVVYGKLSVEKPTLLRNSRIEEPFDDDDGLIVMRGRSDSYLSAAKQRAPKAHKTLVEPKKSSSLSKQDDNRWTPVETSTTSVEDLATTTALTTTTTTSPANSTMEVGAHRSASDLNYIYSSQPDSLSSRSSYSSGGNGYYSNYLVPASQPATQTLVEQPAAIVDTTSGQVPEMISDRIPEQPVAPVVSSSGYDYSQPQTSVSSFQPAQPLPPRQPQPMPQPTSSYGYSQQQLQQSQRAQQPAPQVVKQEHHYHYYNNNNQQQQEPLRQQQPERQVSVQQPPTSQIIREIQPLLISQPFMQQPQQQPTTSTTPAPPPPQIIREIIRETPMAPQPARVIQLAQPMPMIAPQPLRELEPAAIQYSVESSPAQRIIRQMVTNSLPSVNVRLPQLPPIRLSALQLPIRLASPSNPAPAVTRQTGTFVIPPMPKKTTTYYTETQAMPTHTTIMHTTQFTPATRTTVFTTDHDTSSRALPVAAAAAPASAYGTRR